MRYKIFFVITALISLTACTLTACTLGANTKKIHPSAQPIIPASLFKTSITQKTDTLWVFIEGDGTPWHLGRWPAKKPYVQTPVAHPLWLYTQAPALYLKRPCYFNTPKNPMSAPKKLPKGCTPNWWTSDIYSSLVVSQLNNELHKQLTKLRYKNYLLIGHSGGGTLAMLMAKQARHKPRLIVTLAGNLNPAQFNKRHNLPTNTNTNTNMLIMPPVKIRQWHYAGEKDTLIPFELINNTCQKNTQSRCYKLNNTTHTEGWSSHWPTIEQNIHHFLNIKKHQ